MTIHNEHNIKSNEPNNIFYCDIFFIVNTKLIELILIIYFLFIIHINILIYYLR